MNRPNAHPSPCYCEVCHEARVGLIINQNLAGAGMLPIQRTPPGPTAPQHTAVVRRSPVDGRGLWIFLRLDGVPVDVHPASAEGFRKAAAWIRLDAGLAWSRNARLHSAPGGPAVTISSADEAPCGV